MNLYARSYVRSGWLFLWEPHSHGYAPRATKMAILCVMLIRAFEPSPWLLFPNELLFEVFYWL